MESKSHIKFNLRTTSHMGVAKDVSQVEALLPALDAPQATLGRLRFGRLDLKFLWLTVFEAHICKRVKVSNSEKNRYTNQDYTVSTDHPQAPTTVGSRSLEGYET
jgi:hypothetical protein